VTGPIGGTLHSALHAAGPLAARILPLWRFMLIVACVLFVLVLGSALVAVFRRRGPDGADAPAERTLVGAVSGATGVTIVILFVFLVFSFSVGRAVTSPPRPAVVVALTGHQWWWDVEYDDSIPQRHLETANELYVPVGKPVLFRLAAADVIHSFWVPSLAGKTDLIPGKLNSMWFQADTPGVYRAQCAEFCGHQHAKMALVVVAVPPDSFARWYDAQLKPPPPPADSTLARGQQVFLGSSCVLCHSISGTPAGARSGPDLTHIGSRLTLGAGTLANTRSNLAGWIVDPQRIKPGVRMPPNRLPQQDLGPLLAYLESLR
jgi:cytochrome c oxidase subunit 2